MLPYWRVWSTIGMFFFLFGLVFSQFKRISHFSIGQKGILFGFSSLLLLYLISAIFSSEEKNWFELQKRVALFIIPFSILLNKDLKSDYLLFALKSFIASITLLNAFTLIKTIVFYTQQGNLPFSNGPDIFEILIIDRPYFGLLNALASASLLFLVQKKRLSKKTAYGLLCFCVFMVNLITARAAMGIIVFILLAHILFSFRTQYIGKITGWMMLVLTIMSTFFYLNSNLQERFKNVSKNDPRTFIWPSVLDVLNHKEFDWVLGAKGEVEGQNLLSLQYKKEYETNGRWKWVYGDNFLFNTHNQFLGLYLSFGILGLCFYLTPFLFCFYEALKTKNFLLLTITLTFFATSLVENITARQVGVYSLCMFLSIALIAQSISPKSLDNSNG